jgi:nucleoid DNA-binding protein
MAERKKEKDDRFVIHRSMIIKELAKRLDFTIGDVKLILDGFTELLMEALAQNKVIKISRLFKIYLADVAGHDGWDAVRQQKLYIKDFRKVVVTPYGGLTDMAKVSMLPTEEKEGLPYFENDLEKLGNYDKLSESEISDFDELDSDEDWDEMVSEENED